MDTGQLFVLLLFGWLLYVIVKRVNKNKDEKSEREEEVRIERNKEEAVRRFAEIRKKADEEYQQKYGAEIERIKMVSKKFKENTRTVSNTPHNKIKNEKPLSQSQLIEKAIDEHRKILIEYSNYHGEISKRTLSDIRYNNEFDGYKNDHIKAYCHLRNEERSFKIERIRSVDIL